MERMINNLIESFSKENLINLFRRLNRTFSPRNENLDHIFNDNRDIAEHYSEIELLGEGKIMDDTGNLSFENDFIVVSAQSLNELNIRSSKKRQFEIGRKILNYYRFPLGFFVFYDQNGNFRFSFIRSRAVGNRRVFTSFKRYTYFVSRELTNKTFISRFSRADFHSLKSILEVFNVEPVTKEFYRQLQSWYFRALEEGRFPEEVENSENKKKEAVIRLITRLMFVWFMREKKLIPDDLFKRMTLERLVKDFGEGSNYYLAVLQNLFFATLSVPMDKRRFRKGTSYHGRNRDYGDQYVFRYQSLIINVEELFGIFRDIPFLNGGLFECLDYKDEEGRRHFIDGFTETRQEQNRPVLPDRLFFGSEDLPGIIDIFKSYNFTVDENDPNDIEVALDPELLGNVFENLLAVFNPESTEKARKNTGSFYTPKKVVDFMVKESLKIYYTQSLQDEEFKALVEKLLNQEEFDTQNIDKYKKELVRLTNRLRIVDPAVGSGAFPMSILNKLVYILERIDPDNALWKAEQKEVLKNVPDQRIRQKLEAEVDRLFERKNADFFRKLYLIQKVIYGVDIQNTAIEIAKLRFFISLLVEEEVDENIENKGLMPLPNLDFKLMQGDSLREKCCGIDFNFEIEKKEIGKIDFEDKEKTLINEILELKEKFSVEPEIRRKKDLRNKIFKKLIELAQQKIENYRYILVNYKKDLNKFITKYIPALRNHLPDKKNYTKAEIHDAIDRLKEEVANKLNQMLKDRLPKEFFLWKIFFAEVFAEKEGFDIVIGNPPYIQLQNRLPNDESMHYADLYKDEGFETFTRTGDIYALFYELGLKILHEGGLLSYITSNKWMRAAYGKKLRAFLSKYNPRVLVDLGPNVFYSATVDTNILIVEKKQTTKHALKAVALRHQDLSRITGQDFMILNELDPNSWIILSPEGQKIKEKIEQKGTPLKDWDVNIYRGILTGYNEAFIIDGKTKDRLIAQDPKSAEIIKPILRGRDIKRYKAEFADLWLINTHNGYVNSEGKRIPPVDINNYPAVKEHLDRFWDKLVKRQDKGITPYNLRNCAYMEEFEKEKIVYQELTQQASFTLDINMSYISNTAYLITGNSIKYLLALLNSELIEFYFSQFVSISLGGKGIRWLNQYMQLLSIPKIPQEQQKPFEELVEQVIAKKESGEDTAALEKKIDLMVYKLYDLTYDEVKIVDPAFDMSKEEYEKFELKN